MKNVIRYSAILSILLFVFACENNDIAPDAKVDILAKANPQIPINYNVHLSADNEVAATPVISKANGHVKFQLNKAGTELSYKLFVANMENVRASHIHLAPEGQNGPVVVFLFGGPTVENPNGVLAEGTLTSANLIGLLAGQTIEDLMDHIEAGNAYVNVHTNNYPGGEIRGQIGK